MPDALLAQVPSCFCGTYRSLFPHLPVPHLLLDVQVCRGFVESVGLYTFGGQLQHAVTAHPKVDPASGKMHFFCYKCVPSPAASHYRP